MNQITQACPHTVYKALTTFWLTAYPRIFTIYIWLCIKTNTLCAEFGETWCIEQNGFSSSICKCGALSTSRGNALTKYTHNCPVRGRYWVSVGCSVWTKLHMTSCWDKKKIVSYWTTRVDCIQFFSHFPLRLHEPILFRKHREPWIYCMPSVGVCFMSFIFSTMLCFAEVGQLGLLQWFSDKCMIAAVSMYQR